MNILIKRITSIIEICEREIKDLETGHSFERNRMISNRRAVIINANSILADLEDNAQRDIDQILEQKTGEL